MSENLPESIVIQNNSIPLNTIANGNQTGNNILWNGTEWIAQTSGGPLYGTANQIDVDVVGDTNFISLSSPIITPGTLTTQTLSSTNSRLIQTATFGARAPIVENSTFQTPIYSGTATQTGTNLVGDATNFTQEMVGQIFLFDNNGQSAYITSFVDATTLTLTSSLNNTGTFKIYALNTKLSLINKNNGIFSDLPPNLFAITPVNKNLTFQGRVAQSGTTITGIGTNFTSDMIGGLIIYFYSPFVEGGIITDVASTTQMTSNKSVTVSDSFYIVCYPGFQVDTVGNSLFYSKVYQSELLNSSTTLSSYFDSILDTSTGALTFTQPNSINNQCKLIRLKNRRANTATVNFTLGTLDLTPSNPMRQLRYNADLAYWFIETGSSIVAPTPNSFYPTTQLGLKLITTNVVSSQGRSIAINADGTTLVVGSPDLDTGIGAAWIYVRSGTSWTQQGDALIGTDYIGSPYQGSSVSISADGNTVAVGGLYDDNTIGAAWVYTRSGTIWSQQAKLIANDYTGFEVYQGVSCALSADGNTLAVGGYNDDSYTGATWIYTRADGTWTQQTKLVGTGFTGCSFQGCSVALSADGNIVAVGGYGDDSLIGAVWVFTRSNSSWTQQGNKLVANDEIGAGRFGEFVAITSAGNKFATGALADNSLVGAAWVFTNTVTGWTQQGSKITASDAVAGSWLGSSVSITSDGNTLALGGYNDNAAKGAVWIFTYANSWSQKGSKLTGSDETGAGQFGRAVSLSSNGNLLAIGAPDDNSLVGAAWVFK